MRELRPTIAGLHWNNCRTALARGRCRKLVWEIEKKLATDGARPIIHHARTATCWQPKVKGFTIMVNSQYNGWRMEDVWLDK